MGSDVCKFYFKTPCFQHDPRWRYNRAFNERTDMKSAHQPTRKWPVMCDNFHRFGMWPPGAVFGWAEKMMRLLAHLEHEGAWDRQGSLFCERLKGKICSSCRFFPPHGGGRRCKMKYQREAVCVCLCVCHSVCMWQANSKTLKLMSGSTQEPISDQARHLSTTQMC